MLYIMNATLTNRPVRLARGAENPRGCAETTGKLRARRGPGVFEPSVFGSEAKSRAD